MKKQIITSLLVLAVFFACQEQFENKPVSNNFDKTTGEQIPKTDAERWVTRYNQLQGAGKVQSSGFNISPEQLDAMLKTEDLIGIGLHHATDENGTHHVIAVPITSITGSALENSKYLVDTNTNQKVDAETARQWTGVYASNNPGGIWYHQFGSDILKEINSKVNLSSVEISPALNDEMEPQLVLVTKIRSASGRIMGDDGAYDKSNPGPGR